MDLRIHFKNILKKEEWNDREKYMCWMIWMLLLVFCMIYLWTMWKNQCKQNRMLPRKEKIDVLNLGSTYAYYDFDYTNLKIKGYNLANIPQYLDYDMNLLKVYIKHMQKGGKVLIVLPNFVFLGNKTMDDKKTYYEALHPWEIENFKFRSLMRYIFKAASEPITHTYEKEANKWKGYVATYDEKIHHAEKRIKDWTENLGVPNVRTDEITDKLVDRIEVNKKRVSEIIDCCKEYGVEPIIIIPPVSKIMKEKVSDSCMGRYLRQPIREVVKENEVRVLDYMKGKEFEEVELYLNSDCLNAEGRRKFTLRVLQDIGIYNEM